MECDASFFHLIVEINLFKLHYLLVTPLDPSFILIIIRVMYLINLVIFMTIEEH